MCRQEQNAIDDLLQIQSYGKLGAEHREVGAMHGDFPCPNIFIIIYTSTITPGVQFRGSEGSLVRHGVVLGVWQG